MTTTKYQTYPKYKPSNIDWLGDIPEEWAVKRLKYISNTRVSNVDKKSEDEIPVKLCNYIDVYKNEFINEKINFMIATATSGQISSFELKTGDVILTKDSEEPDDIGISAHVDLKDTKNVVCGYHLAIATPHDSVLLGKYLFRLFQSNIFRSYFEVSSHGVTRFGLDSYSIFNANITLPSLPEQCAITDYLDRKTVKIDEIVAKKQKLIELLLEKRQAIISQAVTKGLNPKAKMKDSDIPWLGEIPEDWQLKRLRFACKTNPPKSEYKGDKDIEITFLAMESVGEDGELNIEDIRKLKEVYSGYTYFTDEDILVAKITPCFENGKGVYVSGLTNGLGFGSTEFHVLRANRLVLPEYLYFITYSHPFRKIGEALMEGAAGQKRIPEDFIKNFTIGIPSIEEQINIISEIKSKSEIIQTLVNKIRLQSQKLQEFRQVLISNIVTGKVKVN